MTEQNFHQAPQIADRGYILVEGRIVFEGQSPAELSEPEFVKKDYLSV
jgi:branched-chain amino acid transport system ATP-binding protein